jgi:dephospho-CoA kinase
MTRLNDIVYRFVVPEVQRRLGSDDGLYAVDAINLLESGLAELCDCTLAVTAPAELRVRRIMARDHISEQYARMRVTAQKSDEYYRTKCDYELSNATESPEQFRQETLKYLRRLLETIKEEQAHGQE